MYVAKYLSIYLYLQPGECIHVLLYSKINLFVNIFYCFEIWVKYKQEEKEKRKRKKKMKKNIVWLCTFDTNDFKNDSNDTHRFPY